MILLAVAAALGAAVVGAVASESKDAAITTPLTITDCKGPVRLILTREEAITFLKERWDAKSYGLSGPFKHPPGEKVVIELREGPPSEGTEFAPSDPLHTDC